MLTPLGERREDQRFRSALRDVLVERAKECRSSDPALHKIDQIDSAMSELLDLVPTVLEIRGDLADIEDLHRQIEASPEKLAEILLVASGTTDRFPQEQQALIHAADRTADTVIGILNSVYRGRAANLIEIQIKIKSVAKNLIELPDEMIFLGIRDTQRQGIQDLSARLVKLLQLTEKSASDQLFAAISSVSEGWATLRVELQNLKNITGLEASNFSALRRVVREYHSAAEVRRLYDEATRRAVNFKVLGVSDLACYVGLAAADSEILDTSKRAAEQAKIIQGLSDQQFCQAVRVYLEEYRSNAASRIIIRTLVIDRFNLAHDELIALLSYVGREQDCSIAQTTHKNIGDFYTQVNRAEELLRGYQNARVVTEKERQDLSAALQEIGIAEASFRIVSNLALGRDSLTRSDISAQILQLVKDKKVEIGHQLHLLEEQILDSSLDADRQKLIETLIESKMSDEEISRQFGIVNLCFSHVSKDLLNSLAADVSTLRTRRTAEQRDTVERNAQRELEEKRDFLTQYHGLDSATATLLAGELTIDQIIEIEEVLDQKVGQIVGAFVDQDQARSAIQEIVKRFPAVYHCEKLVLEKWSTLLSGIVVALESRGRGSFSRLLERAAAERELELIGPDHLAYTQAYARELTKSNLSAVGTAIDLLLPRSLVKFTGSISETVVSQTSRTIEDLKKEAYRQSDSPKLVKVAEAIINASISRPGYTESFDRIKRSMGVMDDAYLLDQALKLLARCGVVSYKGNSCTFTETEEAITQPYFKMLWRSRLDKK